MFASFRWFILAVTVVAISVAAPAQTSASDANTTCNFDSNKQLAVEYRRVEPTKKKDGMGKSIPYGKVWAPGGKPLTLFANTAFAVGWQGHFPMAPTPCSSSRTKSPGPLSFRKVPTLAANTTKRRILRGIPMQFGKLPQAEPAFTACFAHTRTRSMQPSPGPGKGPRLGCL